MRCNKKGGTLPLDLNRLRLRRRMKKSLFRPWAGTAQGDRRRPWLQKEGVISCLWPAPNEFAIRSVWSYEDECAARVGRDISEGILYENGLGLLG
jgi:hypothetical protein